MFLLRAVAGMIGAVAGRLARIIDRARLVEERALAAPDAGGHAMRWRVATLRLRGPPGNALHRAADLLRPNADRPDHHPAVPGRDPTCRAGALGRLASARRGSGFSAALLCFLAETFIATRLLTFPVAGLGR